MIKSLVRSIYEVYLRTKRKFRIIDFMHSKMISECSAVLKIRYQKKNVLCSHYWSERIVFSLSRTTFILEEALDFSKFSSSWNFSYLIYANIFIFYRRCWIAKWPLRKVHGNERKRAFANSHNLSTLLYYARLWKKEDLPKYKIEI